MPVGTLRRFRDHRNGVLTPVEQESFDSALTELMSHAARRLSEQSGRPDWRQMIDRARAGGDKGGPGGGPTKGGPGRQGREEQSLRRLARRIDQQIDVAETLAPDVDWSFAQPPQEALRPGHVEDGTGGRTSSANASEGKADDSQSVADLEARLSDQVELVAVMSDIAEVSRRTFALEEQRDLQNTRTTFFGFIVSVAVIAAGWAPIVASDASVRWWTLALTVATCVIAGLVYLLVRKWQDREASRQDVSDAQALDNP